MTADAPTSGSALSCGLIMPISAMPGYSEEHWAEVAMIITEAVTAISELQFRVKMVSDADAVGVIQRRIVQNVYSSDIVICDVSAKNPNVMFELGMRLAFDKPTVIIKDDQTDYTFDTAPIEHLTYPRDLRFSKMIAFTSNLRAKLIATYKAARDNPTHSTFLKNFGDFQVPMLARGLTINEQELDKVAERLYERMKSRESHTETDAPRVIRSPHETNMPVTLESIEKGEFLLHYQPIVDSNDQVVGVEALVRRLNPKHELEFPSAFLPRMEQDGLMRAIQLWIVEGIANDYRKWRQAAIQIPRLNINFSLRQLQEADIRLVGEIAAAAGLSLQAELTESDLVLSAEELLPKLFTFKEMGIGIAVDDFGTGYSSLSYLKKLPLDSLKIDQTFVHDLVTDPDAHSIILAIIRLAHSLNLKVAAEGVENAEQAARLKTLDCDEMQGYLFGKPMPACELRAFLGARHNR